MIAIALLSILIVLIWRFRHHPQFHQFWPGTSFNVGSFVIVRNFNSYTNYSTGSEVEYTRDQVYYNGSPLNIEYKSKHGSTLVTSSDSITYALNLDLKIPSLLLLVGDVNNDGAYVLLQEINHQILIQTLAPYQLGNLTWIAADNNHLEFKNWRKQLNLTEKVEDLLLIENQAVINFSHNTINVINGPYHESLQYVSFSPDKRKIVRLTQYFQHPAIIVNDIVESSQQTFFIDESRMWYDSSIQINQDWIAYYFEWKKNNQNQFVLQKKQNPVDRTYSGHINTFNINEFEVLWPRMKFDAFDTIKLIINKRINTTPSDCKTSELMDQQYMKSCQYIINSNNNREPISVYMTSDKGLIIKGNKNLNEIILQISQDIDHQISLKPDIIKVKQKTDSLATHFINELIKSNPKILNKIPQDRLHTYIEEQIQNAVSSGLIDARDVMKFIVSSIDQK